MAEDTELNCSVVDAFSEVISLVKPSIDSFSVLIAFTMLLMSNLDDAADIVKKYFCTESIAISSL